MIWPEIAFIFNIVLILFYRVYFFDFFSFSFSFFLVFFYLVIEDYIIDIYNIIDLEGLKKF